MRKRNTIINSCTSIICYAISTLLMLIIRKVILNNLGSEYLGYDGLFKNILSMISIAELGVGSALTYHLYEVVTNKDDDETEKLMYLYKILYICIAGIYLLVGMILIPFLPRLVNQASLSEKTITLYYLLHLAGTISSFLLAYKRVRFIAEQKEYICISLELVTTIFSEVIRLVVIYWFSSYIVYLLVTIFQNIFTNILISILYKIYFGKYKKVKITMAYCNELNVLKDMKNFMAQKIGNLIYGATDNIVISSILGIAQVAYFNNYTVLINYINIFVGKLINPMIASVANLIYEDKNHAKEFYYKLDCLCFCIGTFLVTGIVACIQPFISLWLGKEYLLNWEFIGLIILNLYIAWTNMGLTVYISALGNFEIDRNYWLMSGVVNLLLSLILAKSMGFSGIMVGTVIGHILISLGRYKIVSKNITNQSIINYVKTQFFRMIFVIAESIFVYFCTNFIPSGWGFLIIRGGIAVVLTLILDFLVLRHYKRYVDMWKYIYILIQKATKTGVKKDE